MVSQVAGGVIYTSGNKELATFDGTILPLSLFHGILLSQRSPLLRYYTLFAAHRSRLPHSFAQERVNQQNVLESE